LQAKFQKAIKVLCCQIIPIFVTILQVLAKKGLPFVALNGVRSEGGKIIFVAFNPITYIKESRAELAKVIWPTRQETIRMTTVVIVILVIVGGYIAGLDALFASIVARFLR
jgi:preprotein translocase subunit SecE